MVTNVRVTTTVAEVLSAFLEDPEGERYGFELIRATRQPSGTLYPILSRLERAGWVEARWEETEADGDRPARRYYRLTPDGLAAARSHLSALRQRLNRALGEQTAW